MCNCQNSTNRNGDYPSTTRSGMIGGLCSSTDGHRVWNSSMSISNMNSTKSKGENLYSSNDTINNYVIATQDYNENISRIALAKLPYEYQLPIFIGLSNENKFRIFTEKINLLLETESFNQQEQDHLLSILTFGKPSFYNAQNSKDSEERNSFVKSWINKAKNIFNWDNRKIKSYVGTFLTAYEQMSVNEQKNINNNVGNPIDYTGEPTCNCASESDFCNQGYSCTYPNCRTGGNCGFLLWFTCDNKCSQSINLRKPNSTFLQTL